MKAYIFNKRGNKKKFLFSVEADTRDQVADKIASESEKLKAESFGLYMQIDDLAKAYRKGGYSYSDKYDSQNPLAFIIENEEVAEKTIAWIQQNEEARTLAKTYPARHFYVMEYLKTRNEKCLKKIREVYPEFAL